MTLRSSMLATLAYFDTQEYPLTAVEAWEWLYAPDIQRTVLCGRTVLPAIGEVSATLDDLVAEKAVVFHHGFFFLSQEPRADDGEGELRDKKNPPSMRVPQNRMASATDQEAGTGRERLVAERKRRERVSFYKLRRARRAVRLISWIPWIRMVAVANTLAWRHAKEESDIDLFIVTAQGRIWTVRLLVGLTLSLFGLRRHGARVKDKMCLSFFVSEDALDLSKIAIHSMSLRGEIPPPVIASPDDSVGAKQSDAARHPERSKAESKDPLRSMDSVRSLDCARDDNVTDIYLIYWIASLIPLLDRGGMTMVRDANDWIMGYLPHAFPCMSSRAKSCRITGRSRGIPPLRFASVGMKVGGRCERMVRWLQLRKMRAHPRGARATPTAVVISDQMLKFHEEDKRQEIAEAWLARMKEIGGAIPTKI